MAHGPRGWQCPECWKKKRKDAKGKPPKLVATGTTIPASYISRRYRCCPVCGTNVVTEERIRTTIEYIKATTKQIKTARLKVGAAQACR